MSKRDTLKTAKYTLWAHEWSYDQKPPKTVRKAKRKERQVGKKIIAKERKRLGK